MPIESIEIENFLELKEIQTKERWRGGGGYKETSARETVELKVVDGGRMTKPRL